MGHPMRLELSRVGLLVYLANHYATRGAPQRDYVCHEKEEEEEDSLLLRIAYMHQFKDSRNALKKHRNANYSCQ